MSLPRNDDFAGMEVLPADMQIEACVLGAILMEAERAIPIVRELLDVSDFYFRHHQIAYEAALKLHDSGQNPDGLALQSQLQSQHQLEQVGGGGVLMSWLNAVPTAANIETHARQVLELSRKRQILQACWRVRRDIGGGAIRADDAVSGLKGELEVISGRGVGADEIVALGDAVGAHLGQLARDLRKAQEQGVLVTGLAGGITTGWPWLDDAMGGWTPGDLVIIAARPNTSKTRVTIYMLGVAAREGHPVGFISLDMPATRLLKYMVPILANVNGANILPEHIYRPAYWDDNQANLLQNVASYADPNGCFWLLDRPRGKTYQALEAYIRALAKRGCKVVAIDQAQNIAGWSGGAVDRGVFYQTLDCLKEAAGHHGVTLLLLHQINREGADFPRMKHLKDTGAFEEFSDFVLLLHDHQRALLNTYGGFVRDGSRVRKPRESDPPESLIRELDMTRDLHMNLDKSRAGATRQEWERYDFQRGVRA